MPAKVPDSRSMAVGAKGTLFVSTREAGNVYALPATPMAIIARAIGTFSRATCHWSARR
ncbi:MAG: hypothetical protein ACRD6I_15710 [Candidatus Acidiferrales bacterium]